MTRFEEYIARKKWEYGDKFDSSRLNPRFIPFFNSGKRIGVQCRHEDGTLWEGIKVHRGTVGVTTGWKPIFLLMSRRTAIGSSFTIGMHDTPVEYRRVKEFGDLFGHAKINPRANHANPKKSYISQLADMLLSNESGSYNASFKIRYYKVGMKAMGELARLLKLKEVNVHFNHGGIAVSGDLILMGMWTPGHGIYVHINKDFPSWGWYYRTIRNMNDYTGGPNNAAKFELLKDVNKLVAALMALRPRVDREDETFDDMFEQGKINPRVNGYRLNPRINGLLTAINSKMDLNGNRYWAFTYLDTRTGKQIHGTISGGESNIYGVLRCMGKADDWDRSIVFSRQELPIREFQRLTKGWKYAGCRSEDIAQYIKDRLKKRSPEGFDDMFERKLIR